MSEATPRMSGNTHEGVGMLYLQYSYVKVGLSEVTPPLAEVSQPLSEATPEAGVTLDAFQPLISQNIFRVDFL